MCISECAISEIVEQTFYCCTVLLWRLLFVNILMVSEYFLLSHIVKDNFENKTFQTFVYISPRVLTLLAVQLF